MASKFSVGNTLFWLVFLVAGAGAFGAGFWYTYGATVNVNARNPLEEPVKPSPPPSEEDAPEHVGRAPIEESVAPGPLPVEQPEAGLVVGAPPSTAPAEANAPLGAAPVEPTALGAARPNAVRMPPAAVATPTAAPVAPGPEVYRVQVGAFDSREQAERQVAELSAAGISSVVVYDAGRYHAQLGAYADRGRAISVADEANIRGYSVVIRH